MINLPLKLVIILQILFYSIFLVILFTKIIERIKEKPKDDDDLKKFKDY